MPVTYAKISSESAEHSEDSLFQAQTHTERELPTTGMEIFDKITVLRWPATFFLLFAILVCGISILHKQPTSQSIGGEVNGLVPHCKLTVPSCVAPV
jgi:hypothetical protein